MYSLVGANGTVTVQGSSATLPAADVLLRNTSGGWESTCGRAVWLERTAERVAIVGCPGNATVAGVALVLVRGGRTRRQAGWRVDAVLRAEKERRGGAESAAGDEFGWQVRFWTLFAAGLCVMPRWRMEHA